MFDTDSFVVGYSFFVRVVDPSKTIVTDPTVELASIVASQELIGFSVFEAVGVVGVHLLKTGNLKVSLLISIELVSYHIT